VDAPPLSKEIAAAKARASEAHPDLAAVFDAHSAFVGRALTCLGVRERELPDAMQEVFLVAHRRLRELERPSALRSWLYAICVRKAMTFRRSAARKREDSVGEVPERNDACSPTPHDDLERTRALAVALEILDHLSDEKRAVFVLYEVEQMPMSEVAEAVGCALQTAYARLYAARREVAQHLARLRARGRVE
jgi:RNA polymerase sigma-70 factor (ECF subfamily)